ncbi:MAG: helix-turn-helix domain-containing protein [Gemmatimonadales bacterium]
MLDKMLPLNPVDVPVALRLADAPEASYQRISDDLGISPSTAHKSVQRLQHAGLLRPESRTVNWLALRDFLGHGLRYVFPARPGAVVRGVPTSHSGPPLAEHIRAEDAIVWPHAEGPATGAEIVPLYPQALRLPARSPRVYELLTLADALRVGRARERKLAMELLERRLNPARRA